MADGKSLLEKAQEAGIEIPVTKTQELQNFKSWLRQQGIIEPLREIPTNRFSPMYRYYYEWLRLNKPTTYTPGQESEAAPLDASTIAPRGAHSLLSDAPPQQPTAPEVVSIGGYDYELITNPETGEQNYNFIGKTPTEGGEITPYQQEQLGIQRAQLGQNQQTIMNERLLAGRMTEFNAGQQELSRQAARSGEGNLAGIEEGLRAQYEAKFEDFRNSIANTPRNFFQRQILQQSTNPFKRDDPGVINEALFNQEGIEKEIGYQDAIIKNTSTLIKEIEARADDGEDTGLTRAGIANPQTQDEVRAANLFKLRDEATAEMSRLRGDLLKEQVKVGQNRDVVEAISRGTKRPLETVPIREAPFTNGGGTVGNVIGRRTLSTTEGDDSDPRPVQDLRLDVPTALRPFLGGNAQLSREDLLSREISNPSAQQFTRLGYESRQQLRGLTDLRGKDEYQRILSNIEQNLPSPTKGTRRRAAVQRV